MTDRVGQQFGNYRLVRLLGRGGSADTYLAEQVYLGTFAAVKLLQPLLSEGEEANFYHEARIIARLQHPNIVRVLDFGSSGNTPYLVMDYAPKGTLRQLYRRGTILPLQTIIPYVKQVAAALQYAHNQHVIHCDVKPENMLLSADNEVLLSDFGIAVVHDASMQKKRSIAGTVIYMAPEQLRGKPHPASDQYALGVIVYEWLCGTSPFRGSQIEVAIQHENKPPPFLRDYIPSLPAEVEQVVLTALAKDPEQRYASIQAFADALEQVASTIDANTVFPALHTDMEQFSATMITPPAHGRSWTNSSSTRRKTIIATLIVLLVIMSVFTVFFTAYVPAQQHMQATATAQVYATSTAQIGDTASALARSTVQAQVTATAQQNLYSQVTSSAPTLTEPLQSPDTNAWDIATYIDTNTKPIGSCRYTDNTYHSKAQAAYLIRCLAEATSYRNLVYQVEINIIQGYLGGLIIHSDANGNGYYFGIGTDGTYILQIVSINDKTRTSVNTALVSGQSAEIKKGNNQPNELAIIAQDNNLYLYINGHYVNSTSDGAHAAGRIGVYADGDPDVAEVVARNAQVWTT